MIALPLALGAIIAALAVRTGLPGLRRLAELSVRHPELVIAACLAQVLNVLTQQARGLWLTVSVGLVVGFCWLNRDRPGMRLITLGLALNALVMAANGGVMPAAPGALAQVHGAPVTEGLVLAWSKAATLGDGAASLAWLGDRLLLPGPLARVAAWSAGDVFLLLGVACLLHATMTRGQRYAAVGA